jgi:uncharacterized phiE125 gp8 family phage protein
MQVELVTAPTAFPVDVEALRRHVWETYDSEAEDDTYFEELLARATAHVETVTNRRLVSQAWRGYLDCWPVGNGPIVLPFGKVTGVTRFNWMGEDASDHILTENTHYAVSVVGYWPKVVPIGSWPSGSLFVVDPIRVEFVAGFGAAAAVPADLKAAILILAAHWYKNREIVRVGNMVSPLPTSFDALIAPWKIRHV